MLADEKMRKALIFIIMVFLVGCVTGKQMYTIPDITKQSTIILRKLPSQSNIYRITIIGKGYIEGNAKIVLILNGKPYKTESLSGNIDFKWDGDWYSDSVTIEYKPSLVKGGSLKLYYNFNDLQ